MLALVLKWIIVVMSLLNAGYMLYDGSRALVTGDYIRPKSGEYAGQLGPWAKIAARVGIDPMSSVMKSVFVVFGIVGLIVTLAFAFGVPWGWRALLAFNICSLWNLYFGTASGTLQIILLAVWRVIV